MPYLHHCLHHHYSSHFQGYSSSLVRNLLLLDWQDQATHNFVLHQYQERHLQQPQLDLRLSVVESLFDSIDRLIFNRPHNRLNPIIKEQSYFLEEKESLPDKTNTGFQFIFLYTQIKSGFKKKQDQRYSDPKARNG